MIDTPAFKRWFNGSKIVDASGKPLRVYHGTFSDIHAFDPNASTHPLGMMFFSTDPTFASAYAGTSGGNVVPCYLRVTKLFDFRTEWRLAYKFCREVGELDGAEQGIRTALYGREDIEDEDNPMIHAGEMGADEFAEAIQRGVYPALEYEFFVNWLRNQGFDGIVILENGAINYAVFRPEQVKSAISNKGTFGLDNGNISETVAR